MAFPPVSCLALSERELGGVLEDTVGDDQAVKRTDQS